MLESYVKSAGGRLEGMSDAEVFCYRLGQVRVCVWCAGVQGVYMCVQCVWRRVYARMGCTLSQ